MRTPAAAVAAWVEWVVWTCNTGNQLVTVKRERASVRSFFWGVPRRENSAPRAHDSPVPCRRRLGTWPGTHQPLDLRRLDGSAEKSALGGIETGASYESEHLAALNASRARHEFQSVCEIGDRLHDQQRLAHTNYVGNERVIDLDLRERQSVEFRER